MTLPPYAIPRAGEAPHLGRGLQSCRVGYVPFAMGHYIENTGDTVLRFLEMFKSPRFADVSLNQWMALTPPELVQAHLNLTPTVIVVTIAIFALLVPARQATRSLPRRSTT